MLFAVTWRRDRMLAFLNPESDPLGKGFHIMQSLIAVGSGGFRGRGLYGWAAKALLPAGAAD